MWLGHELGKHREAAIKYIKIMKPELMTNVLTATTLVNVDTRGGELAKEQSRFVPNFY